ncbi:MAG: hypothetical protein H0U65_09225 [Rubrobacter sp.]|nr:hypothetical protein [Rubrobacter sp.]
MSQRRFFGRGVVDLFSGCEQLPIVARQNHADYESGEREHQSYYRHREKWNPQSCLLTIADVERLSATFDDIRPSLLKRGYGKIRKL